MKKIDLHLHTIATSSDAHFEFSLEKLLSYATTMEMDCIAVTNHNTFDLVQFRKIDAELNILILPGIEIDLANGHLLLIADGNNLVDFAQKCEEVKLKIATKNDSLSVQEFKNIFQDLSKYLLIPHYDKKPAITQETIRLLDPYITAGEVTSIRKFKTCVKEDDKLVPLIFSDQRFHDELQTFSTRQTYIDLQEISFQGIKAALFDKNKVSLSKEDGNEIFQVTDNGVKLSTGLNVVMGERSSGKTHLLDKISKAFDNVKYIKQFALLQNDEEKFEEKHKIREASTAESFLKEFKHVLEDVSKIDLRENEREVENYINTLVKYASENDKVDTFSKATLFAESMFVEVRLETLKKLIESTVQLIENLEFREIIDKHINIGSLKALSIELMNTYVQTEESNRKKRWINELLKDIQTELRFRTNCTHPEEIDFYRILLESKKVERFTGIVTHLKNEREIERKEIRSFKVVAQSKKYTGAAQLKAKSRRMLAFREAFDNYHNPYLFLQALKCMELEETDYYQYFVDVEYKTLNKHGFSVSGGERSEFKLLHEINDALKHDLLLIDEPESSFDNLFLKNEVNELIKEISKQIPVIVVTHNSTVGASIQPDYILYTQKIIQLNTVTYKVYAGYPSSKELTDLDGAKIENYEILLNCLEAGNEAYYERRNKSYEILKN